MSISTPNGGGLITEIPPEVSLELRIEKLEAQLKTFAWLHAELAFQQKAIANTMAAMLAQQIQPQVQQALLNQILSG